MANWIDTVMVLLALTNLVLLGSSRLAVLIRMVALQGLLLGLLPVLIHERDLGVYDCLLALGVVVLKGIVFPVMLSRAREQANVKREVEPFLSYTLSVLAGLGTLMFAQWLSARLPLPPTIASSQVVPLAFFTVLVGLFLIITRRKALTQVIGYLATENGIYAFGLAMAVESPLVVEFAVLLDVFVGVFIMGIIIFHISREFDHIDADRLTSLKDGSQRWDRSPLLEVERAADKEQA